MSNPIQDLLNQMIKNQLPTINSGVQAAIKSNHLDPWGQVAHGSSTIGSVNLGIATVGVSANYNVNNMSGLSSFSISALEVQTVTADPNDSSKLSGHIYMTASLGRNLTAHAGGGLKASFKNFIHNISKSVGIGGTANVSGISTNASGSFSASVENGKVCLNAIDLSSVGVDYGSVNVSIDGLGFFNSFISPVTDAIVGLFKGQIRGAISNAITPMINAQIRGILPQCKSL
ncbi:hypothetical protein [uncultured Algibacter sp.]|uniref:hypothetical protein n=1 Tax=uncultured Algibacter sp. TaxID=298659 RepID=UPI003217B0A1